MHRRGANWTGVSLALLVVLPFLFTSVAGDGVIIDPWGMPFEEGAQTAVVLWKDGLETLALHVSSTSPEGSFWLIPIPNEPETVAVSHVSSLTFSGYDRGVEAWRAAKSWASFWFVGGALSSQFYPVVSPFSWLLLYRLGIRRPPIYVPLLENAEWLTREEGTVTVHEVVESFGLTSYVVTADDAEALYGFMYDIGLKVPEEVKVVLANYIGSRFSFVVSKVQQWTIREAERPANLSIPEREDLSRMPIVRPQGLGIVITFPSDAPFYPLVPTSVYGSKVVPVRLYLNGLWDIPNLGQPLFTFTKVEHFVYSHISIYTSPEVRPLSGAELSEYTLVVMDPPSKYLTTDLTFRPASLMQLGVNFSWVLGILMFLACSVAASGITSVLLGGRNKRDVAKWSVLGLSNSLTILGYYWATSRVLGKERHETSDWRVLSVTAITIPLLLFAGASVIEFWLILPHYHLLSVVGTLVFSLVALSPALAVAWIYSKLNSSSTALGASRTSIPVNGKAAGQSLLFSVVFVILLAVVTNLLLL